MNWVLILTIMAGDGVTSQQIPMDEKDCRHYEQQYNSGVHNTRLMYEYSYDRAYRTVFYTAQCLKVKQ